jgi:hypothetical protein
MQYFHLPIYFVTQAIARQGRWMKDVLVTHYLPIYSPQTALVQAGFNLQEPWAKLYHQVHWLVKIDQQLMDYAMPFVASFQNLVKAAGDKAPLSAQHWAFDILPYLQKVLVQDALILRDINPNCFINRRLMQHPDFRCVHMLSLVMHMIYA